MDETPYRKPVRQTPYRALSDNAVIDEAKRIHGKFRELPRWSAENDRLLRDWAAVCMEMSVRGITDTVTEGGSTDVLGWIELETGDE